MDIFPLCIILTITNVILIFISFGIWAIATVLHDLAKKRGKSCPKID